MTVQIYSLSCDPSRPEAGQSFRLTVELETAADASIIISLEKQRILAANGTPELRPTGPDYFQIGPKPIAIKMGEKSGMSEPIIVKVNAKAESGEPPVAFPENLLFSAFAGQPTKRFACTVVPVSSAEHFKT